MNMIFVKKWSSDNAVKVLGLDVGEKRIGVAVSDALGWTAQGVTVLNRKDNYYEIEELRSLVESMEVTHVVVGLPRNMDGSLGPSAQRIQLFARAIEQRLSVPVILWDERWTTAEATRILIEADVSRKRRREVVDKLAAVLILQSYLDGRSKSGETE